MPLGALLSAHSPSLSTTPPTVRSLSPVVLSTLLSSSTLLSALLVTAVPSASVIDTPLVVREARTAALAVGGDEEVADVELEKDGDGAGPVAVGVAGETEEEVDEVEAVDNEADLEEEPEVSLGVGLLSAVIVSSSDCRTMGSM